MLTRSPTLCIHSLLWAFLPPLLLNIVFVLQPWFDVWLIYVDPLLAAQLAKDGCCNRSFGFASSIGVLYWAGAASCCALAASGLWRGTLPWPKIRLLLLAALFIGFLCLDDLFMLHENVLPRLGVPEKLTLVGYALLAMAYLVVNWRVVLGADPLLFGAALGFLGLSVLVDLHGNEAGILWKHVLEEAAKLMGVAGWCVWHIRFAHAALRAQTA